MPRGSCDGDTFSAEAPSSEESLVCFRLSEPAQGAFYSAQRFRELSCLDGVGSESVTALRRVCLCLYPMLLTHFTSVGLHRVCFMLQARVPYWMSSFVCVCPVELLEEPAPLTASGDEAGPSHLLDWTPWYCALWSICALSHCCPEWGDVSRDHHPLSVHRFILVCSCKTPGS